jgi:hypothetical protein
VTLNLWIAAHHDAGLKHGGWAFVRAEGAGPVGWAGGDRRTTRARMALAGFAAALKDTPAGAPLAVVAPRADALVLHTLLKPPEEPPADDLDLRAALAKALAGRVWTLALGDPGGPTPVAFAAAWAETAAAKAKAGGAFQVAIPRVNLAKVRGL